MQCCVPAKLKQKILFVDDEASFCELLSLYLEHKGFQVSAALTSVEAKSLIEKTHFDLAILDLNLGPDDGLGLLGFLKNKCPTLPVLIFNGIDGDDEEGSCRVCKRVRTQGSIP